MTTMTMEPAMYSNKPHLHCWPKQETRLCQYAMNSPVFPLQFRQIVTLSLY